MFEDRRVYGAWDDDFISLVVPVNRFFQKWFWISK